MYVCPLCMKTEYLSLDSLCFELTKVTIKHIRCPVCDETVLGLDKYTIHLYSHLLQKEKLSKNRTKIETVTLNVLVKNMCKALDHQNADSNDLPRTGRNQTNIKGTVTTSKRNSEPICQNIDPSKFYTCPNVCNLDNDSSPYNRCVEQSSVLNQVSVINPPESSSNVILSFAQNLIPSLERPNVPQNFSVNPSLPLEGSQPTAIGTLTGKSTPMEVTPKLYILPPGAAGVESVAKSSELMTIDNKDILWNLVPGEHRTSNPSPFEFEDLIKLKPSERDQDSGDKTEEVSQHGQAPHKCHLCSFTFPDLGILKMHQQLVHKQNPLAKLNKKVYCCQYCNKGFKMKGSLLVHHRVAHKHLFPDMDGEKVKNAEGRDSPDEPFKGNDYKCNICSKTFKKEQFLTQHYKTHESKQWECDVCAKSFTTKYFLRKHKRLHTGDQRYFCELCNKAFTFQQSYHKHVLYHSDEKPYSCMTCGRAFKEMSTLHNHERIHTGEKPYSCETCGKSFRQRISCLVHSRIHTGAMPYECTACHKKFRYKGSEKSHKCPVSPPGQIVLCDTDKKPRNLLTSIKKKLSVDDQIVEPSKPDLAPVPPASVEPNGPAFVQPFQEYYYVVGPAAHAVDTPTQPSGSPGSGTLFAPGSVKHGADQSGSETHSSTTKIHLPNPNLGSGNARNSATLDPAMQVLTPDFFFDPDELFSSLTFSP